MKIAYFDCFAGISGDMFLGALLDAGLDVAVLKKELEKLPLKDYAVEVGKKKFNGITGTKLDIRIPAKQPHRTLKDIEAIIQKSGISTAAKEKSLKIFQELAEAEGEVHGVKAAEVHFHEVGAVDSILDIVGSVVALELLDIGRVFVSRVPLGSGFVNCRHGKIPVPAPATAALLKNLPVYDSGIQAELTTPTGAAIIKNICAGWGMMPDMTIESIGYGAGSRELEIPNFLRVYLGRKKEAAYQRDQVCQIETNIDDMNPEIYEYVSDKLRQAGALDVYTTPVYMKKSRPGILLSVIAAMGLKDALVDIIFRETTTIGIRIREVERKKLDRQGLVVDTAYGSVKVKVSRLGKTVVNVAPEYESCKEIAEKNDVPLKTVYEEARYSARKSLTP